MSPQRMIGVVLLVVGIALIIKLVNFKMMLRITKSETE